MIDRQDVAQMSKFIAALDRPAGTTDTSAKLPSGEGVAEMKAILERFHAAADNIIAEAPIDREFREALVTEPTAHGARIGPWEIRARTLRTHKMYDVVNVLNNQPLASDLLLYEAAHGLVRILNEGGRINSPAAIELLNAEQEYGQLVQDMVLYKHRLTKQPNSPRRPIFEARYGDAKRRAILARERVQRLAETR
jgi:hypothetical protein